MEANPAFFPSSFPSSHHPPPPPGLLLGQILGVPSIPGILRRPPRPASSHTASAIVPPKLSSSVSLMGGGSVPKVPAGDRHLANKTSPPRSPSSPYPPATAQQDPLLSSTIPASSTRRRATTVPEYPSNTTPPLSLQPPATHGGKNPDARGAMAKWICRKSWILLW